MTNRPEPCVYCDRATFMRIKGENRCLRHLNAKDWNGDVKREVQAVQRTRERRRP